jgi:hypothetical protein
MKVSRKIKTCETQKGKSLFAVEKILKDEVIFEFEKSFSTKRTTTSMQIDEKLHQESKDPKNVENFINHSCSPNGYINFEDLTYKALRDIKPGEELTVNYLTHELELANPFKCLCGSKNCYGNIRGFRFLTLNQQKELAPFISPYLKSKLKNEKNI